MNLDRSRVVMVIGAVIMVIAQIVLAPLITLFSAQPNFLLAYVLVISIICPHKIGSLLPFVLGLVYDCLGTGPFGGMAFLFVLASFIVARAFLVLDNDTLFMPLALFIVAALVVEMIYGGILIAFGLGVTPLEAFLYRAFPCALYDCVAGLVLYPLVSRFVSGGRQKRGPSTPRLL